MHGPSPHLKFEGCRPPVPPKSLLMVSLSVCIHPSLFSVCISLFQSVCLPISSYPCLCLSFATERVGSSAPSSNLYEDQYSRLFDASEFLYRVY